MIKILLTILLFFYHSNVLSNDPFTNEIGIIKEEEITELKEEVVELDVEEVIEEEQDLEVAEDLFEEDQETIEILENETNSEEIITVLNIDPMVAFSLKNYTLKGTALSKESKDNFVRQKIRKIDKANIPTTHTIEENETIEKIAFRYGFSLREIELANAIYPGSRKLVIGDKLVIPNRFHIVKEGQSLNAVAERYKIDPIQLASYNDINEEDILLIGDKLLLPFFIHVTDENESISDIAGRYERETSELINFNNFDDNTLVLNENQLIKIPIYANNKIDYENLSKKSINDFDIDRKNLAIVEIDGGQFMVREGDRIGNRDGVIVSIESTRMIVLEDNIEFEFLINTPIVGQAIASLPQSNNDTDISDNIDNSEDDSLIETQSENDDNETVTNVEDLFN